MIYCPKSFRLWSKNVGPKCSGAVSIDHYYSKSCCYEIKDKLLLKLLGNYSTLNNLYAFNVHIKKIVFELFIITDEATLRCLLSRENLNSTFSASYILTP